LAHASDVSRFVEWTAFVIDDWPAERRHARQADPVAEEDRRGTLGIDLTMRSLVAKPPHRIEPLRTGHS